MRDGILSWRCDVIGDSEDLFCYGISKPRDYRIQLRAALPPVLTRDWT